MANHSMPFLDLLRKQGQGEEFDFVRQAVLTMAQALIEAEVSARIGAGA